MTYFSILQNMPNELTMNPLVFIGEPIEVKKSIFIYPPSIKTVLKTPFFKHFSQILTVSQEDIWDKVSGKLTTEGEPVIAPTPFLLLLIEFSAGGDRAQLILDAFKFFTKEDIRILVEEKAIILLNNLSEVKTLDNLILLKEEDYFTFQNAVREAIGEKPLEAPVIDEDPRIAKIKAKARERDRIKKKNGSSTDSSLTLTTSMASLCCMSMGLNPLNIGEISYASLNLLIKTYREQEKYKADIQFLAGGADPKKLRPKYWMRNLTD